MKSQTITTEVQKAAELLEGKFRVSKRGVPLVEMMNPFGDGVNYSVCFFASTKVWRIHKDYLAFKDEHERITVPTLNNVIFFFRGMPFETVETGTCDLCEKHVVRPQRLCRFHLSRAEAFV